jgi:histidinol-phosphate phosphatase family protein
MTQAVILAGGKGTRLRERLGDLPKPMIDLCGIPLLERQILLLKRYGFDDILILVNYQAQRIVSFCESKSNWGLRIRCINDGEPRGTAGAVLQIFDLLEPEFLVVYGDTMLNVDLHRFQQFHSQDKECAASLFLHPNDHPHDSDLVDLNEDQYIQAFHSYPHDGSKYLPNLVNAALYLVRKSALKPWLKPTAEVLDFAKNIFPAMLQHGSSLRGYNSPEYIKDCGTPARIDKVSADFTSGKIARFALDNKQNAVFIDRDGTINEEVNHLNSVDQFKLIEGVDEAIKRLNKSEYRTCVVTNQPVVARGECSFEELKQIHNKFESLLGLKGAFIDRIYFCPHHPDSGFKGEIAELKRHCTCRKPNTGMIDKAVAELNIDISQSWMIGDSTSDVLAARSAGLKSILVETGLAGTDRKYSITPDFKVPNLGSAIDFLLDTYPQIFNQLETALDRVTRGSVIFIGGYQCVGKSNVASVVRDWLRANGLSSRIFSTLLTNRFVGGDDSATFEYKPSTETEQFLNALSKTDGDPQRLTIPNSLRPRADGNEQDNFLVTSNTDVIIFEGIDALYLATRVSGAIGIFVERDEQYRKQRVVAENFRQGYSVEESSQLYEKQMSNEIPWIDTFAIGARRITSSNNNFRSTTELTR